MLTPLTESSELIQNVFPKSDRGLSLVEVLSRMRASHSAAVAPADLPQRRRHSTHWCVSSQHTGYRSISACAHVAFQLPGATPAWPLSTDRTQLLNIGHCVLRCTLQNLRQRRSVALKSNIRNFWRLRLIYPDGKFYRRWSLMMAIPMIYTAIITPLYIGLLDTPPALIFVLDRVMDVVFISDLVRSGGSCLCADPALATWT